MNVYCVYTAMSCMQQQQNSHKKVKAMTNLVGFLIVCIQCGSRSTSVFCALLYIRKRVQRDYTSGRCKCIK